MSFTISDLITVVNKEADFHREHADRLKHDKRDSSQYYRHQYISQSMSAIQSILEKNIPASELVDTEFFAPEKHTDTSTDNVPLKEKILKFINTIPEFSGIDPFDENMPIQSRVDAIIMFIMSDNKQRNGSAIYKEMKNIIPNHGCDKKIVERRVYTLANKKNLLEKNEKMRGFCKIRQDLIDFHTKVDEDLC